MGLAATLVFARNHSGYRAWLDLDVDDERWDAEPRTNRR
jgi:hypothetical protein